MDAEKKAALKTKTKQLAVLVGIVAVLAVVLYFVGLSQGRSQVAVVEAQQSETLAELAQTQAQLARAQGRNRMMRAQVLVYQTMLDLDARNFGMANERIQEAAALMLQGDADAASDPAAFTRLAGQMQQTNLRVAADLRQQRALIQGFGQQLGALIPVEALPAAAAMEADSASTEGDGASN